MSTLKLREQTYRLLEESLPNEQDLDAKVRHLLVEYLRRLAAYRHTDRTLGKKYTMNFQEFSARRIVQQRGFTFDVETDAMDWETAVSGIQTMERQLCALRESGAPEGRTRQADHQAQPAQEDRVRPAGSFLGGAPPQTADLEKDKQAQRTDH